MIIFLISLALAQTPQTNPGDPKATPGPAINPETQELLKDRFISTIRETAVDSKAQDITEFKTCADRNKITMDDIKSNNTTEMKRKEEAAQTCFQQEIQSKNDLKSLEEMQQKLKLEQLGLVKGNDAKAMLNYLSDRLKKALYKIDETKPPQLFKEQQLVDQKVFFELYKTQLGKVIILETAKFCYEDLTSVKDKVEGSETFAAKAGSMSSCAQLNQNKEIVFIDTCPFEDLGYKPKNTPANNQTPLPAKTSKDVIQHIGDELGNNPNAISTSTFLECAAIMRGLCKKYSDNLGTSNALKVGQRSCLVESKLRTYQKNLDLLKKTETLWASMQGGVGFAKTGESGVYNSSASDETSIDALTTMTSKEVGAMYEKVDQKTIDKEFAQYCESNPEDTKCSKFEYTDKERLTFENSRESYDAATEVEAKIIKAKTLDLVKKPDDLKKYLNDKGYLDILKKYEETPTMSADDMEKLIVTKMRGEREAAFEEMAKVFQKKQLNKNEATKVTDYKNEIADKKSKLTELMVFNNMISGYLTSKDAGAKSADPGKRYINQAKRELQAAKEAGVEDKYFTDLKTNAKSSSGDDGSSIDAINFVNALLGSKPVK